MESDEDGREETRSQVSKDTDADVVEHQPHKGDGSKDTVRTSAVIENGHFGVRAVRGRSVSEGSNSEEDLQKKQKVNVAAGVPPSKRVNIPPQAAGFLFPGIAASPPRFMSLEQIMKATNAVSNMSLAHEIVVNKDFKLEKSDLVEDSLQGQIKKIVHKAFWDVLESQLNEDPPCYDHSLNLLSEIKADLISLLLPHSTKLLVEINEVLDIDLIRQQAEKGVLDFHKYAQYIISVMYKMCAPVRDERIQELMRIGDVIPLFRGIFETLDLMKLDMANFHIELIRPQLQEQTIEYEKKKFAEYLTVHDDGLECTEAWLRRGFTRLEAKSKSTETEAAASSTAITAAEIITEAYMELLQWDEAIQFPETLLMDQTRFMELRKRVQHTTLTAAVLLVTYGTVGSAIEGISNLKEQLKSHVEVLLETIDKQVMTEALKNVAVQVTSEVNECLVKHGFPELSIEKEGILTGQLEEVSNPTHKVRQLVKRRILEFVECCLSSLTASPVRIPPGLSSMHKELSQITGQFLRLVSHNRAVFDSSYADIVKKLRARNSTNVE